MIDNLYQSALATLKHHLEQAGVEYATDDGEIVVGPHRLGLAIAFDGCVPHDNQVLAPLDIQLHVDGDTGDRFRIGAIGVGANAEQAIESGIAEWHTLAVWPVMSALGADVEKRRPAKRQQMAGWDVFPGRVGLRGEMPAELATGGAFLRSLLECLRQIVAQWDKPPRFTLHSIYVMATRGATVEVQSAVDGMVNEELTARLADLDWPAAAGTYLYKQLFVFRNQPPE